MYCVIMFEYSHPGETLTPSEQVNEVFGPFDDDQEAAQWAVRAGKLILNRNWLIIPMSDISVLDQLEKELHAS